MAYPPENLKDPSLQPFGERRGLKRLAAAIELSQIVKHHVQLERELPNVAANFRSSPRAFRRLGYVAGLENDDFKPRFIVADGGRGSLAGIGSLQRHAPNSAFNPKTSVEVSYWHDQVADARTFGRDTVRQLEYAALTGLTAPADTLWGVTLVNDISKAAAMEQAHFEPFSAPQEYMIEDGVSEPRQLWVKDARVLSLDI